MTDQMVNLIYEQLSLLSTATSASRPIWVDIVLGFVMAIVSAVFALWYQGRNGPRFIITVGITSDDQRGIPPRHVKFAHITVVNSPRHYWLLRRRTAHSCHGWVDFLNVEGRQVVPRMAIRWSGAPQPLKPELTNGGSVLLYDPSLLHSGGYVDIPPDRSATISPALRLEEPNAAFGWTTESYAYDWKHPKYALPFGQYIVRVTVQTEDYSEPKKFLLTNPRDFEGFAFAEM